MFHESEAIRLDPLMVDAYVNLGTMLYDMDRNEDSLEVSSDSV